MPSKSTSTRATAEESLAAIDSAGVADGGRSFEAETLRLGHRERLRERFLEGGADSMPELKRNVEGYRAQLAEY